VTRDSPLCQAFYGYFNHCYEGTYIDGEVRQQKRKNATDFESQTNECMEYHCYNDTGRLSWSLCNSTDVLTNICVDGKCVGGNDYTPGSRRWSVVVELSDDEVKAGDLDFTEIAVAASNMTGIDFTDIVVGAVFDDEGYVVRIILYVDDEQKAKVMADEMKVKAEGGDCEYGVICKAKSVTIHVTDPDLDVLSSSVSVHTTEMVMMIIVLLVFMAK